MSFVERLDDPDEEVRHHAVFDLGLIPQEGLAPFILKALGDTSWRVRKATIEAIFNLEDPPKVIPILLDGLRSEDNAGLRNSCLEVLTRIGKRTLPYLVEAIKDQDKDLRKFAVDILGDIGGKEVVDTLISVVNDEDENVRLAAIEALGKVGSEKAKDALLELLKVGDLPIKFTTLEALRGIGGDIPMEEVYKASHERLLKRAAYDLMGKAGDVSAIPYLVDGLKETSPSTRESAMVAIRSLAMRVGEGEIKEAFTRLPTPDLGKIVLSLENPNLDVVRGAIFVLMMIGDVSAIPNLLKAASSEEVVKDVAKAILGFGEKAVPYLVGAYQKGEDRIRALICYLLGEIGDKKNEGLLIDALKDDYGHVRSQAALALGKTGSETTIHHIIRLLEDGYEDVRRSAVDALILLGERYKKVVLEGLIPLFHSGSSTLREELVFILGRLGGKEGMGVIRSAFKDPHPNVRKAAIYAGKGEKGFLHDIVLALADEDADVRLASAKVLGDMGHEEAFIPLLSAIKDDNIWVRCAAIEGLGKIGDIRAVDSIKGFVVDENGMLAMASLSALARLSPKDEDIISWIVKALSHPDKEVVKGAIEIVGKAGKWEALLPLLKHRAWDVRLAVVSALRAIDEPTVKDALNAHLQTEGDEMVRRKIEDAFY